MNGGLRILTFTDPTEFRAVLKPLIAQHPARSTMLNTVLHNQIAAPYSEAQPVMSAISDSFGAIMAAGLQTPPYPLSVMINPAVTDRSMVAAALAESVRAVDPVLDAVSGHVDDAPVFVSTWAKLTGTTGGQVKRLLLHRLIAFVPPVDVIGSARNADEHSTSDNQVIDQWWYEFALAAGTVPRPEAPRAGVLALRAARGHQTVLWCVQGRPVAVAGAGAAVAGVVRLAPVYTPPAERGHRYGSAVTAAAVEAAYRCGADEVELFTDADYPTANNIYRRLGFVPIDTFAEITLRPAD